MQETKTMKKILIAILMFSTAGIAQGAIIIGATDGVTKHTVEGFGSGDSLVAQANLMDTLAVLTDVGTPVVSSTADDTTGLVAGFIHDYVFTAVQDTFASVQSAVQLSGSQAGTFITPLVLLIYHLDGTGILDPDTLLGFDAVTDDGNNTTRSASISTQLVQGETYVVRMSNESASASLGTDPNYTVKVISAVPVPAAVWLFGTALLGLFGFKRKSQAAAAVAA